MDIRLDTKFFQHPKTMKLYRRLGAEGVLSLFRLWLWAAENRPTGYLLGLSSEDIDLIAGGQTRPDPTDQNQTVSFCQLAKEYGWIDTEGETLVLHEWNQYNPWVADAPNRSDKARFSKLASVAPAAYFRLAQEGRTSITAEEYRDIVKNMAPTKRQRNADEVPTENNGRTAPIPNPAPAPVKRTDPDMDKLLMAYRRFPGYRAELEVKEREWLHGLSERFKDLDVLEEVEKAKSWINLKQDFSVRNSRAYLTRWLERVQKERS